ncbi:uncharacterized protein EDB91DRAFT_1250039 [Suillus paluster]|uniref:uncharacterized protein n=1 Tax=Suillus paluster TaxID=48578 RepID=UPI001B86636F|nr:uncharacterized protein EDB91DRAFT_1250039 [Suillus paluster]KAG1736415.1 hypothetical protein EDB91DRAFT_1250039 [Suillus paluster]
MAQPEVNAPPQAKLPHAQWSDGEITALVNYLYEHHSDAEGAGNFKPQVYAAAGNAINIDEALQLTWMGLPKTEKSTRNKWTWLKNIYYAIEKYRNQTGVHWDNENGAGIEGPAVAVVWMLYLKSNQSMHPFRNKGWEHYKKMQAIIPLGGARGRHVFHPGGAAPPTTNTDSELGGPTSEDAARPTGAVAGPSGTTTITTSIAAHSTTTHSTTASSNAGKCPYSEALSEMETASFGSTHVSSMQPPSTTLVSAPPSKKARTPAGSQHSHATKISSALKAAKITLAAAVVGMQGTINRLTDVFKWFVKGGPDGAQGSDDLVTQAICVLEGEDSDIPPDQQAVLIAILGLKGNEHYLKFYVNLRDKRGRRAFVAKLINQPVDAGADAGMRGADDPEMMG